jgi:uncharacterized repeat protein (TIGR01451 family)
MKTMSGNVSHPVLSTVTALLTLLVVTIGVQNAPAATLVVTSLADTGPDAPTPGSLRAALANASDGDTIDATGLNGTITLIAGASLAADLVIDKNVTVLGPGAANLTIDANQLGRAFNVTNSTVTLADITITHGNASSGGGIRNDHSQLTLNRCVFSHNSATSGAVIYNNAIDGISHLTINDCVFSENQALASGGAIMSQAFNGSATVSIANSTFHNNSASIGGAIHKIEGELKVQNSTFSGNSALTGDGAGGAIANIEGPLSVVNSTLSGNSARSGGAIYNRAATALVANSTFSGNTASVAGGGILNRTFDGIATLMIGDSILRAGAAGANIRNESGTIVSYGYNLSSDSGVEGIGGSGDLTAAGDQLNTDPLLGPLADNGGMTLTHLPSAGSPALDRGTSDLLVAFSITTDQRGFARTVDDPLIPNAALGDGTDIGAVEVGGAAPPPVAADVAVSLGVDKNSVKQGELLTYTITVSNFGPGNAADVVINNTLSSGATFVSARASKGSFTTPPPNQTGVVTWTLGELANGEAADAQLVVTVIVRGKTTITNTAMVSTTSTDSNSVNNVASITTSIASGGSKGGRK